MYILSTSYVEIIIEATISRFVSYPDVGVIFDAFLSSSQQLVVTDPEDTLYSCSGTQNEKATTHNNMIEV